MSIFIGIDIGTTHAKVIASSDEGFIVHEEKTTYQLYQPQDGFCEQDAEEISLTVFAALKNTIQKLSKEKISAIGFSCFFHGVMAVDETGIPLTRIITWADTRSNEYAKKLLRSGAGKQIFKRTGTPIHPMSPLCKIAWIRDKMPHVFGKASKFISIKEYIWHKLFDSYQVDYSIASATGLFDIKELKWDEQALKFCGIAPQHLSGPVSPLYAETGLTEKWRTELGLDKDVSFVIGAGDGATSNLGSGVIAPGEAALTIGTSGAMRTTLTRPEVDGDGKLFTYLLADNLYVHGGAINNGGIVIQWFLENFMEVGNWQGREQELFFDEAAKAEAGAGGLIFLPYLLGERTPVWDAGAKGVFFGIKAMHKRKHFMRAAMEGICFSILQVMKLLEKNADINTVYAAGGFAQSPLWLQAMADILNKKIVIRGTPDASAMGALIMAMYANGTIKEWKEITKYFGSEKEFLPQPEENRRYQRNIRIFENLYIKLRDDFEESS
jgi:gluconokinase